MRDLAGKTAFVTGGASGIGLALGLAFAQAGMKVMLADIETDALASAVEEPEEVCGRVDGVICDVADPASVERAAQGLLRGLRKCPCGLQQRRRRRRRRHRQHLARQLAMGARRQSDGRAARHPNLPAAHPGAR